jgi:hypothetical protein
VETDPSVLIGCHVQGDQVGQQALHLNALQPAAKGLASATDSQIRLSPPAIKPPQFLLVPIKADAAMPPIALCWGAADSSFRSPMAVAVAVIGGLITSTVLSLLVVPAVFTHIDDLEHWFKRMAGNVRRSPPATQTPAPPATHSPH